MLNFFRYPIRVETRRSRASPDARADILVTLDGVKLLVRLTKQRPNLSDTRSLFHSSSWSHFSGLDIVKCQEVCGAQSCAYSLFDTTQVDRDYIDAMELLFPLQ
jgi:hypothetical protein